MSKKTLISNPRVLKTEGLFSEQYVTIIKNFKKYISSIYNKNTNLIMV